MPLETPTSQRRVYQNCYSDYTSDYLSISYDSCLKQDVATERDLPLEDFMSLIFNVDDWAKVVASSKVKDISENPKFKSLLKEYDESDEGGDVYRHFVILANHILKAGTPEASNSIAFVLNGPLEKDGLHTTRGPNAFVAGVAFDDCEGNGIIEASEELPFNWADIRCYVEIRADGEKWTTASKYSSNSKPGEECDTSLSRQTWGHSNKRPRAEEWCESSSKRRRRRVTDTELKLRCARHALETLSSGGLRTHAIGLYIDDHDLHLHYFDRSIFISSTPICFKENPSALIALILTLQRLDSCQWGFVPGYDRPVILQFPNPRCLTGSPLDEDPPTTLTLKNGWTLEPLNTLSRQRVLTGRGTIVIRGRVTKAPPLYQNRILAIKVSSPSRSRRSENDILQLIYDKDTGVFEPMLEHLPKLSYAEDVDLGPNSSREKLSAFFKNDNNVYEARALRLMVFPELQPLQGLLTTEELSKAFRDIFKCYRWLYEEVKILHRDISLYNMMYYRNKDGQVRGVLNDFDLATVIGDSSPSPHQRAGTKPFMAYELLLDDTTPHLYRHDLESFFYVVLILTSHFSNGKEIASPPYKNWFSLSLNSRILASMKTNILLGGIGYPMRPMTPPYTAFRTWLLRMRYMFQKGMICLDDEEDRDAETRGGHITLDKMAEIFDIDLSDNDKLQPSV